MSVNLCKFKKYGQDGGYERLPLDARRNATIGVLGKFGRWLKHEYVHEFTDARPGDESFERSSDDLFEVTHRETLDRFLKRHEANFDPKTDPASCYVPVNDAYPIPRSAALRILAAGIDGRGTELGEPIKGGGYTWKRVIEGSGIKERKIYAETARRIWRLGAYVRSRPGEFAKTIDAIRSMVNERDPKRLEEVRIHVLPLNPGFEPTIRRDLMFILANP